MKVEIESTHLDGVIVVRHDVYRDERGFFTEVYHRDLFGALGLASEFVQDNHSRSGKNVVRGLHFQWEPPMGKLIRVTRGRGFLVAVDVRKGSPHFGEWYGREFEEADGLQLWAPAGFARGFASLSDVTEIQYKCTGVYNAGAEGGIAWNDPDVGIRWPVADPVLSDRDRRAPLLHEWAGTPAADHLAYGTGR